MDITKAAGAFLSVLLRSIAACYLGCFLLVLAWSGGDLSDAMAMSLLVGTIAGIPLAIMLAFRAAFRATRRSGEHTPSPISPSARRRARIVATIAGVGAGALALFAMGLGRSPPAIQDVMSLMFAAYLAAIAIWMLVESWTYGWLIARASQGVSDATAS